MSHLHALEPEKDFEIELSKQPSKKTSKFSPRTVEVVASDNQPTLRFKKDGKVKEEYVIRTISEVAEVRHNESTNLIQLTSPANEVFFIRTKTKATKERWITYLKTWVQEHERNIYESEYETPNPEPHRRRAPTADNHLVRRQRTTPRKPKYTQSVVDSHTTVIPQTAQNMVLDAVHEGEFDGVLPLISADEAPRGIQGANGGSNSAHFIYDVPQDEGPTVIVNINVKGSRHQEPIPPLRHDSMRRDGPARQGEQGEWPRSAPSESGRRVGSRTDRKPVPRPRNPPTGGPKVEDLVAALRDLKVANGGESPCPQGRRSHRRPDNEQDSASRCPYPQEEGNVYENVPRGPGVYVERTQPVVTADRRRGAMPSRNRCKSASGTADDLKREQTDGTVVHIIARNQLQEVGMRTLSSGGVWVDSVPADLKGKLFHGDMIVNINEQRIENNEEFARVLIATSERDTIRVTIQRLPRGHIIEIERLSPGDPLGFQLDRTQVTSVAPGSPVTKQLGQTALTERLCLTHLNDEYVPLLKERNEVNQSLREAGLRFFIILQPLDFIEELTRRR